MKRAALILAASLAASSASADPPIDWKIGHHYAAPPGTMACMNVEDGREILAAGAENGYLAMTMAHLPRTARIDRQTGQPICGFLNFGPITILEIDVAAEVRYVSWQMESAEFQLVKVQPPDLPFSLYALLWQNRVVRE